GRTANPLFRGFKSRRGLQLTISKSPFEATFLLVVGVLAMNKEEIRELAFNSPAEQLNHLVAKHIFDNEVRLMDTTVLMTDLRTCTSCPRLVASRTQVVTYDGDPNPDVVFVGEAP